MKPIIVDLKDISDSTEVYDSKPNRFVPYTIYIICAILTIALIWMYLFRMDIVVKADSVFRGDDDSTAVSCAVTGKITKMSVKDGNDEIVIYIASLRAMKRLGQNYNVHINPELVGNLTEFLGEKNVKIVEKSIEKK